MNARPLFVGGTSSNAGKSWMATAICASLRRQGFAVVAEENIRGVLSVGAPIRDRNGRVLAALSVAFPKYLEAGLTLQSVTPLVTGAARRVSQAVGG